MARINCSRNLAAFLDVLAYAEGTRVWATTATTSW